MKNIKNKKIVKIMIYLTISICIFLFYIYTYLNSLGILPEERKVRYENTKARIIMEIVKNHYLEQQKKPTLIEIEKFIITVNPPPAFREYSNVNDKIRVKEDKNKIIMYYIGPDGIDQKGNIIYDPTNGLKSNGDICMELFKK